MIAKREEKILKGSKELEPGEPSQPIKGGVPKNIKAVPDIYLKEGDYVGSLTVISTPGHTPGSLSFLDKRDNILIGGDSFQTRGGMGVSGDLRLSFPFPALATWNKQEAVKSAKKIAAYRPSVLAVGHGKMVHTPLKDIERAILKAEKSIKKSGISIG